MQAEAEPACANRFPFHNVLSRGEPVLLQPTLANIIGPTMVFWFGWEVLLGVLAGILVELLLIKLIFKLDWLRAVRLGLLVNLASTIVGLVLMWPGGLFLLMFFLEPVCAILCLFFAAYVSAYLHRLMADVFMVPIHDPFCFRWLLLINFIGIGISVAGLGLWLWVKWHRYSWL